MGKIKQYYALVFVDSDGQESMVLDEGTGEPAVSENKDELEKRFYDLIDNDSYFLKNLSS